MPPLIAINPTTATMPLAPEKYQTLVTVLANNKDAAGFEASGDSGSITLQKITFAWTYNGTDTLTISITSDHNWEAKMAGNAAIFEHLNEQLQKM